MKLNPGHQVSLMSKKTGACVELKIENGAIVVCTQDITATITTSAEGIYLETDGEVLVGRLESE